MSEGPPLPFENWKAMLQQVLVVVAILAVLGMALAFAARMFSDA